MSVPVNTCLHGDALEMLRTLPDECVHTCVTSPPYWGLRDYGTATWEGGDPGCDHTPRATPRESRASGGLTGGKSTVNAGTIQRDCHCGARRIDSQLGLEPTPEEYVSRMVAVFREVRRVLRTDGTLWLNLGDSFSGSSMSGGVGNGAIAGTQQGNRKSDDLRFSRVRDTGIKPKDLVGIPWRVAFALQADGWYLRSDIIWNKPNPMPESVTDRPTKAHEYVFLMSRSDRYYYDAEAIAEAASDPARPAQKWNGRGHDSGTGNQADQWADSGREWDAPGLRNRRSVWTVATSPYPDAHFAVFPPKLIEPCILAGAPKGGIVLDPFLGSGTTAQVAQDLGRQWLGVELNPDYIAMQHRRTAQQALDL